MAKKKQKRFEMHPQLLMDVIKRQAGSLGKAVLEGVMNSVDAGATYCNIAISEDVVLIEDDGGGFPDEDTVDKCFNTFGQPHDKNEQKVYGNFRMGRGQMFAFGHNIWESGPFTFDVDIKTRGNKWLYEEGEDTGVAGCRISIHLYEVMRPSLLAELERDLKRLVKWVSIPVSLNDVVISSDPAKAAWDYKSATCFVKLKASCSLVVYNLGVYVKTLPAYTYGRGGEVVSKQQLRLNFARNDIMVQECPIWKEVAKFVAKEAGKEIRRKPAINDAERQRLADQFIAGDLLEDEQKKLKLFTDVNGRHYSLKQLLNLAYTLPCYTSASRGDRRGDTVQQHKLGFVFSDETLARFHVDTAPQLIASIRVAPGVRGLFGSDRMFVAWKFIPFEELAKGISTRFQLVPEKEWTLHEKIWLRMASQENFKLAVAVSKVTNTVTRARKIVIGLSDAYLAWTDGLTHIAIERNWLKYLAFDNLSDSVRLGELLLHEWCHDGPDTDSHTHSPDFYAKYHDATHQGAVAHFAEGVFRGIPGTIAAMERKMNKAMLRGQDAIHRVDKATSSMAATAANRK